MSAPAEETAMRVLLIYVITENVNMPVLPLGLASVAAAAEADGHAVRLIMVGRDDCRAGIEAAVAGWAPDVIGISVRNIDDQSRESPAFLLADVRPAVEACRRAGPAPVVVGGAGYSIYPEAALEYLGADYGVRGEGERAFVALLQRLAAGVPADGIPGLVRPGPSSAVPPRPIHRLDDLPLVDPSRHLHLPDSFDGEEIWMPFGTRRGCPMGCSYCSTAGIEGRMIRRLSPERAVAALSRFVSAGFSRFFFVDNTFNLPRAYARRLCEAIAAADLGIQWRCILYPWKVDPDLADKMAAAGCVELSLGFESGDPDVLRGLNKRFGPDEVRRISDLFGERGIRRMGFLLLGGPDESLESAERSLAFADSLNLEAVKITLGIRVYPGTQLARRAAAEGMIDPADPLLRPTFYLRPELSAPLREMVGRWMADRPNWMF